MGGGAYDEDGTGIAGFHGRHEKIKPKPSSKKSQEFGLLSCFLWYAKFEIQMLYLRKEDCYRNENLYNEMYLECLRTKQS